MSVSQLAHVVGRYWRSIAVILVVVVALSATATALTPARYTASSSLFLGVRGAESASDLNQGGSYMERQVASYAKVATSSMVLTPVIARLGLAASPGELARDLAVTSPANTAILEISASQPSPALAQALADAVAEELVVAVKRLAPTSGDEALVTATITDPAELPLTQSSPRVLQNLALGSVLALLLAFGQAVLRQRLDTRVRHVEDAVEATGLGVLAGIAREGVKQPNSYGYGTSQEDLRSLRTNLRFLGLGTTRNPHLVVTSSVAGEGKTHVSVGLARVLADSGERVLLIDADLRRPRVAERLGLDSGVGLSQVLSGQVPFADAVIRSEQGGFDVLPSGPIPPNPAELLGRDAMRRLLDEVRPGYDLVILDTAPVLPVTDGVVLSALAGAALLVARSGMVTKSQLAAAAQALQAGGGDVAGVVLNGTEGNVHAYQAAETSDRLVPSAKRLARR